MKKSSNLWVLIFLGLMWSTFAALTKVAAEGFSPYFVAFGRLVIGGIFLLCVCAIRRKKIFIAQNFRHYAVVGFFNSALPFTLFSFASRALDSGVVAILDGSVPMFEVLISILILGRQVDRSSIFGIIFGIIGIAITSLEHGASLEISGPELVAVILIMIATCGYAIAFLYMDSKCKHIESMSMATGSVWLAAAMLLPLVFVSNFDLVTQKSIFSLIGLGLICTGIPYIFYFKLAAEEGPRIATSVVLLIPVLGTIVGAIFLDEPVSENKIIGCITILVSMKFILKLSRSSFSSRKKSPIF